MDGQESFVDADGRKRNLRAALAEEADIVRRFLLRLAGDEELARDLVQETMVKAILGFRRFRGEASFRTWLLAIAANLYRDDRRKKRPRPIDDEDRVDDGGAEIERRDRGLEAERAWALLGRLPEPKRKVLVLRMEFDYSYEEIAAILGCPLGTVRSRLHDGLGELRRAMGGIDERRSARN